MQLSAEQRGLVDDERCNLAVEAVPGAGKTRVIVARIEQLIRAHAVPPQAILVLTFSRRAVRELRERVALVLGDEAGAVEVRTFHGFASRLLRVEHPGFTSGRLVEQPAAEFIVEEAFASTPPAGFTREVMRSPAFARDAERYVVDLLRAGPETRAQLSREGSARLRDLTGVAERLSDLRRRLGVVDYDDLVARAAALARDPQTRLHAWLEGRYRHVLVDEFQDTDAQQLALLEALNAQIFAVGDAAQAIYGFRGAARDAIARGAERLAMQRRRLGRSYRCPQAICDFVNATAGLPNEQRIETAVADAGSVDVAAAATPLDEAVLVADRVRAALDAGVAPSRVAVLLRSLEPLGSLIREELERRGIATALLGGDAILAETIVRTTLDALHAVADPGVLERWIDLFASPVFGFARLRVVRALNARRPCDLDGVVAVLRELPEGRLAPAKIEQTLQSVARAWREGDVAAAAHAAARGFDVLGAALLEGEARAQRAARRLRRMLDALDDLVRVRRQLGQDSDPLAVLRALEAHASRWPDDTEEPAGVEVVHVLTIHAAKGLEFDTVVLADAADGRMPVDLRRSAIVGDDDAALARTLGCDLGATAGEQLDEERALYYVAATRARRDLLVTYSTLALDGTPTAPSRFLPLDERRRLVDAVPYRAPLPYAGATKVPPRIAPRPVEMPRRIGVTRLDDCFKCERRFFYATALRLPSERAFAMTFGSSIHRVLERFHREHRRVDGSVDRNAWLEVLKAQRRGVWNEAAFDSPLERDAAGASADRMLEAYATVTLDDAAARPFTVEAVEHRVDYDLDGIALSGKIDRLDRFDDGSTRIVDYKTGRLYAGLADGLQKLVDAVAEKRLYAERDPKVGSVQLPIYGEAIGGDPELALVYLRGRGTGKAEIDALPSRGNEALLEGALAAVRGRLADTILRGASEFETTRNLRTCNTCNFYAICDGSLEAVDDQA